MHRTTKTMKKKPDPFKSKPADNNTILRIELSLDGFLLGLFLGFKVFSRFDIFSISLTVQSLPVPVFMFGIMSLKPTLSE